MKEYVDIYSTGKHQEFVSLLGKEIYSKIVPGGKNISHHST